MKHSIKQTIKQVIQPIKQWLTQRITVNIPGRPRSRPLWLGLSFSLSFSLSLLMPIMLVGLSLPSCANRSLTDAFSPEITTGTRDQTSKTPPIDAAATRSAPSLTAMVPTLSTQDLLHESWQAYRQRFIQADGRIIDREAGDRTTSEAQAYALLRSVLMDDQSLFDQILQWAENNLQRRQLNGERQDTLWAWQWGRNGQNQWLPLDLNFASDGDIDAVNALIFAGRRWNRSEYLDLARKKLRDLWNLAVITVQVNGKSLNYLLPGPKEAFQKQQIVYLNPSYFAPYAFRLFAQVDPSRDWLSLVDSSYEGLKQSATLSRLGLPSNWVGLDLSSGKFIAIPDSENLKSIYSFDAYRVWWRVALDATWFEAGQAKRYLEKHLDPLAARWRSQKAIPAKFDLQGQPLVTYESTAQYAMLYAAFQVIDPELAEEIRQEKLLPAYQKGFWENDSAYYSQNLGWLGLYPSAEVAASWLK